MIDLIYLWTGKIVIWTILYILFCILLYAIIKYFVVLYTLILVHVIKEVGVKDKWKRQKLWKLKLFFRFLFNFSFVYDKIIFSGRTYTDDYSIDYSTFIPKFVIYKK